MSGVTLSRASRLPSVLWKPWPHDHPHLQEALLDEELWSQLSATTPQRKPQRKGPRVRRHFMGAGWYRGWSLQEEAPGLPQGRVLVAHGGPRILSRASLTPDQESGPWAQAQLWPGLLTEPRSSCWYSKDWTGPLEKLLLRESRLHDPQGWEQSSRSPGQKTSLLMFLPDVLPSEFIKGMQSSRGLLVGPQGSTGTLTQNGGPKGGGCRNQLLSPGSSGPSAPPMPAWVSGQGSAGPQGAEEPWPIRTGILARSQSGLSLGDPGCPLLWVKVWHPLGWAPDSSGCRRQKGMNQGI